MAEEKNQKTQDESKNEETKDKKEEVKESSSAEATEDKEEAPAEEKKEAPTPAEGEVGGPTENVGQVKPASAEPSRSKPTGKFKDLIKDIESLSVVDLAELVKALEERFGVSAAAPVMAAAPAAGAPGAPAAAPEKSTYTVVLASTGTNKIGAIKALREINPNLGLKEAKDIVDGAPKTIKENASKEDAETAKTKLEEIGATVELK